MEEVRLLSIRGEIFRKEFYEIKLDKEQSVGFKERMIRMEELNAATAEIEKTTGEKPVTGNSSGWFDMEEQEKRSTGAGRFFCGEILTSMVQ